jgi:hypothetical protein
MEPEKYSELNGLIVRLPVTRPIARLLSIHPRLNKVIAYGLHFQPCRVQAPARPPRKQRRHEGPVAELAERFGPRPAPCHVQAAEGPIGRCQRVWVFWDLSAEFGARVTRLAGTAPLKSMRRQQKRKRQQ